MADFVSIDFKFELENQMRKTLMVSVAIAALLAATELSTAQVLLKEQRRSLRLPIRLKVIRRRR